MAKQKNSFSCNTCPFESSKWFGCCPDCKTWDSCSQQISPAKSDGSRKTLLSPLQDIETRPLKRFESKIKEWDRVTGGGIVPGSFMILTGDPGIGKSTLLLQIANELANNYKVFYFSSEESLEQLKLRAERLACINEKLLFSDQADLEEIIEISKAQKPDLIIIDSIQNSFLQDASSIPGSIGQLKEAAFKLMRLAKENTIAVLTSGHITKEGVIAGPKMLEHMVDAVFYLQGEDKWQIRILRSVKNRFGTCSELGFFNMVEQGLQEVTNINQHLLEEVSNTPGSALISYLEGSRPILIELQALTLPTKYPTPQRIISGIDPTQVILISSILEKYLQIKLSAQDLFFKISGGFKIKGSSADLGIALTLLSSYFQKPLPSKCMALAEVSLTGQIKPVNNINLLVTEAEKFGIDRLFIAQNQKIDASCKSTKFKHVYELLSLFE